MNVQPKFTIGQEVWFMRNDVPKNQLIYKIEISSIPYKGIVRNTISDWREPKIVYYFIEENEPSDYYKYENEVFATKEELKKAIFSD